MSHSSGVICGGGFSALWAVFSAPPSDPTDIGGVVIDARLYLFAALITVLLWWFRVIHRVTCGLRRPS